MECLPSVELFIGGSASSCGLQFEGSYNGHSWADKWNVVMNQETALGSAICGSVPVNDSFFHFGSGAATAFINPGGNNFHYINDQFLFNTDVSSIPFISNTPTGTEIVGGYASVSNTTSMSSVTNIGTFINAPTLTRAQVDVLFNSNSAFYFAASDGAGSQGPVRASQIRQTDTSTSLELQDFNGVDHLFIGTAGNNTFLRGDGSHGVIIGNAVTSEFLDTTGRLSTYGGVATSGQGVPPIYGATLQKAETGADANVLTVTPPASAGQYRINFSLSVSAANTATLGWTATWKDANGSAVAPTNLTFNQQGTAAPALTFTTSAAGNYFGSVIVDVDNSQTAIVVKLTFSGTSFTAKASASIERLQ